MRATAENETENRCNALILQQNSEFGISNPEIALYLGASFSDVLRAAARSIVTVDADVAPDSSATAQPTIRCAA